MILQRTHRFELDTTFDLGDFMMEYFCLRYLWWWLLFRRLQMRTTAAAAAAAACLSSPFIQTSPPYGPWSTNISTYDSSDITGEVHEPLCTVSSDPCSSPLSLMPGFSLHWHFGSDIYFSDLDTELLIPCLLHLMQTAEPANGISSSTGQQYDLNFSCTSLLSSLNKQWLNV